MGNFLLCSLISVIGTVVRGFVLTKLWFWFGVLPFHAPQIPIAVCCGLSLVFTTLVLHPGMAEDPEWKAYSHLVKLVALTLIQFWYLGVGWIIHQFV